MYMCMGHRKVHRHAEGSVHTVLSCLNDGGAGGRFRPTIFPCCTPPPLIDSLTCSSKGKEWRLTLQLVSRRTGMTLTTRPDGKIMPCSRPMPMKLLATLIDSPTL